jgi:hypothetical protein
MWFQWLVYLCDPQFWTILGNGQTCSIRLNATETSWEKLPHPQKITPGYYSHAKEVAQRFTQHTFCGIYGPSHPRKFWLSKRSFTMTIVMARIPFAIWHDHNIHPWWRQHCCWHTVPTATKLFPWQNTAGRNWSIQLYQHDWYILNH